MRTKLSFAGISLLMALMLGIGYPSLSQATNIAHLYGVATANSTYQGNQPDNAIDDNWTTPWSAAGHASSINPYWLEVDLQSTYEIAQIVLVGPTTAGYVGYTNNYNLYNSINGTDWNFITTGILVDTNDYVHIINLTSNNLMRYAKYEVFGGTHWANLYEMEIHQTPLPGSLLLLGSEKC